MNYRQEAALQAAKAQIAQDIAHYQYPSQDEIEYALMTMKIENLRQVGNTVNAVLNKLTPGNKSNCGCPLQGKALPTPRYETKSLSRQTKPNHFAKHYQSAIDEEYERFCSQFPDMCRG